MSTSVRGVGWQASRQFHIAGDADKGPVFVEAEAQVAENDQHVTQGTHGGNKVESRLHRIGDPHSIRRIKMKLGLGGQADEAHTQTASLDDEQSGWIAHAAGPRYTWVLRAGDGAVAGASGDVRRQDRKASILVDGVSQKGRAFVEVVVAQDAGVDPKLRVQPVCCVHAIGFGTLTQQLIENRASDLIPTRNGKNDHVTVFTMP